ncbi:MAG: right-handed parallel beta-helix repeat-containing protein, partial [Thermoplasmata archaeon]|nr:right-handed parallel beta-helix repeat-containing protein [Thermoplasmata archaeon]
MEVKLDVGFFLECQGTGRIVVSGTQANNTMFSSNSATPVIGDWPHISTGVGGSFNNATISHGTIGLYAETGSKVIDCTIKACSTGIYVRGTGAYIQGATLWATNVGVAAVDATNALVMDSSVDNVQEGFNMLGTTSGTVFSGCSVNNSVNIGFGIVATGAGNKIVDGYVTRTKVGILIQDLISPTAAGDLQVINCTLVACSDKGIYLNNVDPTQKVLIERCKIWDGNVAIEALTSGNIEVTESTFRENNKGTRLQDCTAGTMVFHKNNYIKNNEEALTINSQADYDKNGYGNFWWKAIFVYGFKDDNSDGIADQVWSLTGTQKDNYPLMDPVDFEDP